MPIKGLGQRLIVDTGAFRLWLRPRVEFNERKRRCLQPVQQRFAVLQHALGTRSAANSERASIGRAESAAKCGRGANCESALQFDS